MKKRRVYLAALMITASLAFSGASAICATETPAANEQPGTVTTEAPGTGNTETGTNGQAGQNTETGKNEQAGQIPESGTGEQGTENKEPGTGEQGTENTETGTGEQGTENPDAPDKEATEAFVVNLKKPIIKNVENTQKGTKISWSKVKDATGYYIVRDGKKIKTIKSSDILSFKDKKAGKNGQKYEYQVFAYAKQDGKIFVSDASKKYSHYYLTSVSFRSAVKRSGSASLEWKSNIKASGFEVMISTDKDYKKAKTLSIKGKITKSTATKLKSNSDYYMRVRAYKTIGNRKCYSAWGEECEIISWNSSWQFAKNSLIHSDPATLYHSDATSKKGKIICVNAGHGTAGGQSKKTLCHPDGSAKVTGGSTAAGSTRAAAVSSGTSLLNGTSEAAATVKLANVVKDKLLEAGYDVLMIRETSDAQLDNIARTLMANNNADCHLALHYDSSQSDKGAFYISVPNVRSYRSMYPVSQYWQKHNKLGASIVAGMKGAGVRIFGNGSMAVDLTQTSYSTVPSVDVEVGDRASSIAQNQHEKIAEGIAAGLDKFYDKK